MLGYSGAAYIKVIRYGIQVHGFKGYQVNDIPAGWIGNGLENISSHLNQI